MKTYEFEDTSVETALNNFIAKYGYTKDDIIDYEVIENRSTGILGFGKKLLKLRINVNDKEFIQRKAKIVLSTILEMMDIKNFHFDTSIRDDSYVINILSEEASLLIGKNAHTLDALQFIIDTIMKKYDCSLDIIVDVENYRANVMKNIKEMIDKKIDYVIMTGRRQKLKPFVPMLRKDIHNYAKKKGVKTKSVGDGLEKIIYIYPNTGKNVRRNA